MDFTLLLSSISFALSIGLSCGTACSPIASTFLTTYVLSHSNGMKKGVLSFVVFFLGKILSVTILCVAASIISKKFINEDGYISNFNLRIATQIVMCLIGIYLVFKWFKNNNSKCNKCKNGCKNNNIVKSNTNNIITIFITGIVYGFTPCTPLLMMIGYTFTLPIYIAMLTGIVFGLATTISPIILLMLITGILSKKIREEIPNFIKWFQLVSYIMLIFMPILLNAK